MSAASWAMIVLGLLFLLLGIIFALQGANVIGGSSLMDGNTTFIYAGAGVAVLGLIFLGAGAYIRRSKKKPAP